MEISQAQAFLVLAEELHFGRAAQRLNMTQPPLSRIIRGLEKQWGVELFTRSTRNVKLTPVGAALIEPARALVAASDDVNTAMADAKAGRTGKLTMGFTGGSFQRGILALTRQLRKDMPRVGVNLISGRLSHVGLSQVIDGTLDIAIGRWNVIPDSIDHLDLESEKMVIALPDSHRLAREKAVSFKDLEKENWIALPGGYGSALHNQLMMLTGKAGYSPNIVQHIDNSWTILVLVSAGAGVTLTLSSVAKSTRVEGVVFKPIADPAPDLMVRLVWRRDSKNPVVAPAIESAKTAFGMRD